VSAAALAAYSALGVLVAAPLLGRATWVERAPRLGLLAWQALSVSVVSAAVLAGATLGLLAVSARPWAADPVGLLGACLLMLASAFATPSGALAATVGLVFAGAVLVRWGYGVAAEWVRAVVERRRHRHVLALVGRGSTRWDATVVDHKATAAYCLPGAGGRVVLTSAALHALDQWQVTAVLEHERAHLRGRHHLLLALAKGTQRAFPFVAAFSLAHCEVTRLVELAADDAARARTDRLTLAAALLAMARGAPSATRHEPRGALAATGRGTGHRIERLLSPIPPLGRVRASAVGLTAVSAAAAPFAIVVVPILDMAGHGCC
jgi:Zn-dependent protease with chaperone function